MSVTLPQEIQNYLKRPVVIIHEGDKFQGYFFVWNELNETSHINLEEELGPDIFEEEYLIPMGVFVFEDNDQEMNGPDGLLEDVGEIELFFFFNVVDGNIYESNDLKMPLSIEAFQIRFLEN